MTSLQKAAPHQLLKWRNTTGIPVQRTCPVSLRLDALVEHNTLWASWWWNTENSHSRDGWFAWQLTSALGSAISADNTGLRRMVSAGLDLRVREAWFFTALTLSAQSACLASKELTGGHTLNSHLGRLPVFMATFSCHGNLKALTRLRSKHSCNYAVRFSSW